MGSGEPTAVPANLPVLCAESMLAGRPGRNRNGHALSHGPVRLPLAETKPEGSAPDGAPDGAPGRAAVTRLFVVFDGELDSAGLWVDAADDWSWAAGSPPAPQVPPGGWAEGLSVEGVEALCRVRGAGGAQAHHAKWNCAPPFMRVHPTPPDPTRPDPTPPLPHPYHTP